MSLFSLTALDIDGLRYFKQIFSGEVPFKFMPYEILAHHIVKENGRPNPRPSGISDALWSLAESCWVTMASERPVISVICQTMERLINVGNSGDPPLSERLTVRWLSFSFQSDVRYSSR